MNSPLTTSAFDLPGTTTRNALIERLRTEERVLILPSGPRSVRFRPSLVVTEDELSQGVAAIARVLDRLEDHRLRPRDRLGDEPLRERLRLQPRLAVPRHGLREQLVDDHRRAGAAHAVTDFAPLTSDCSLP